MWHVSLVSFYHSEPLKKTPLCVASKSSISTPSAEHVYHLQLNQKKDTIHIEIHTKLLDLQKWKKCKEEVWLGTLGLVSGKVLVRCPLNLVEGGGEGRESSSFAAKAPPPSQSSLFACSAFYHLRFSLHCCTAFRLRSLTQLARASPPHQSKNFFISYPHRNFTRCCFASSHCSHSRCGASNLGVWACSWLSVFCFRVFFWGDRKS